MIQKLKDCLLQYQREPAQARKIDYFDTRI